MLHVKEKCGIDGSSSFTLQDCTHPIEHVLQSLWNQLGDAFLGGGAFLTCWNGQFNH